MKERRISRPGAGGPTQPVTLTPPMPGQAEGPEADQPQTQKAGWEDGEAAQARPRIVHVISGLGQGGAETVLYRLCLATQSRYAHEVISLGEAEVFGPRLQSAGIPVRAFGLSGKNILLQGRAALAEALAEIQPDVIQTWMYHANALAGWWAYRLGYQGRIIWNIRNSGQHTEAFSRLSRWSLRVGAWLSRRVPTAIVACAQRAAEQHQRLGYKGPPMTVIPNGIDTDYWQPNQREGQQRRSQLRLEPHMPVIGTVARWHELKDYPNLLAALGQLIQRYPNIKCLLIGDEVVQTNKALMALIREHQLENNVLLLGRREDVRDWLQAMDIFVLASKAEGFPNVVCEAMATGVRAVVTDVGDAAQIVGADGLVVPPRQPAALAGALEQAIHDLGTDAHRQAVVQGRTRVVEQYQLAVMQQAYEQLWQQVAAHAKAGQG